MTEEASHGRATESLLAAKRIYKLQGGHNDILVLPKPCDGRSF
jgi:hypothetical protein